VRHQQTNRAGGHEKYRIVEMVVRNNQKIRKNMGTFSNTCIPDTVKYGISNFTRIGAFLSGAASSSVMLGSRNSALNMYS
jgi:hypothetical protein